MNRINVTAQQFLLMDDKVIHEPTGAWWKARPNAPELSSMYMGQLGAVLSNGDEYDSQQVHDYATKLLSKRLSTTQKTDFAET